MKLIAFIWLIFTILVFDSLVGQNIEKWVQPSSESSDAPVWGHKDGIRVGIAPTPGPRGLLRIFTPYLGHKEDKVFNFVAFEPIPKGETERGFSELEISNLDNVRGKRFWSSSDSICSSPQPPTPSANGIIEHINGVETLSVFVFSESFENGAEVYIKLRFYEDKPYEVELITYNCAESAPLENFILTATMGNYARLRKLHLNNTVKSSLELWPLYNDIHFTSHDVTPVTQMIKDSNGGVYFIAEPDELDPFNAEYATNTRENWFYYGKKATQYWYAANPNSELVGLVNGRYTYWGGNAPIPGGVSIENFEFKTPFKYGEKFIFGISPLNANEFIEIIK